MVWILAVSFTLVIVVQLGLFMAVGWLNSESGQKFVKAQIDNAMAGSGYSLTFSGLRYSPLTAVYLKEINLFDKDGEIAQIKDMRLGLGLFPLATRTLALDLGIDALNVVHIPEKSDEQEKPLFLPVVLPEIELPDVYFKKMILNKIRINALTIKQKDLVLSPQLSGVLHVSRHQVTANFDLNAGKEEWPRVQFKGAMRLHKPSLNVTSLRASTAQGTIIASGSLDFTQGGRSILNISPQIKDMNNLEGLNIRVLLQNGPSILKGELNASAQYNKKKTALKAPFELSGNQADFQGFTMTGLGLDIAGDIHFNPQTPSLDVTLKKIKGIGIDFGGAAAQINVKEKGVLAASLSASGQLYRPFSMTLSGDINPSAQSINHLDGVLSLGKGRVTLSGQADMTALNIKAQANAFPLDALADLPPSITSTKINMNAALSGTPQFPVIESQTDFTPMRFSDKTPEVTLSMDTGYNDHKAVMSLRGHGKGINIMQADANLPLTLSLSPFVFDAGKQTPLQGSAEIRADVGALAEVLMPPGQAFSGAMKFNASLGGDINAPKIKGDINLSGGHYKNENIGLSVNDIALLASLEDGVLDIAKISATDGDKGHLNGKGRINLDAMSIDCSLKADKMHMFKGELANGTLDADLSLKGDSGNYTLGGNITPERFEVNIPETFSAPIPELNIVRPQDAKKHQYMLADKVDLDMQVKAPGQVFVRGWGLDAEFGGNIDITGKLSEPHFDGTLKSLRGRYSEFGRNFDIAHANMNFSGTIPPSPAMDILAETQAGDIKAQIAITGNLMKPEFGFSSVPARPQDEVLSHILFGKNMDKITPLQAAQIAQTIRRFSGQGGGGIDPLGLVRNVTGLDDIRVDTDENGGATLGAGKYLTDKVYLEFEAGSEENSSGATLQIEVTPSIDVESKIGQDAQGGAGVFWHWDY